MPETEEIFANDFDRDLFNLARRAEHRGGAFWDEVAQKLTALRPGIRRHMNEKDREATQ